MNRGMSQDDVYRLIGELYTERWIAEQNLLRNMTDFQKQLQAANDENARLQEAINKTSNAATQ